MMRRVPGGLRPLALLVIAFVSTNAFAQENDDVDGDTRHNTEQPKETEQPVPVLTPAIPATPAAAKPKVGDLSISGYFRGSFGASINGSTAMGSQSSFKGRMTCFKLALPGGMFSKYRLGNECEVWSETHFTMVTYAGDDGSVATLHVMPTVFIPTTYIGYSPSGAATAPDQYQLSTGAVLYFPTLYADIQGIPWLFGGTAWAGTRYYKRESIYISDFFYWNPSGVGAGVEDIKLGNDLRLSYAAFAVDGEPTSQGMSTPSLPLLIDLGIRNDLQLRGITFWPGGEFQLGFQYIANLSRDTNLMGYPNNTHSGWGATFQFVQRWTGSDNKFAVQYGRGGGTGFGTLARFYYPDFSVRHDTSEWRFRILDVITIQPIPLIGAQVAAVFQRDDLGTPGSQQDWISAGGRLSVAPLRHFKVLGEAGYDRVKKSLGAPPQFLAKLTGAVAITADRGFMTRPELRLFFTYALWNDAARIAGVDSGDIYRQFYSDVLNGMTAGLQAETWF
jgi:maltoporin